MNKDKFTNFCGILGVLATVLGTTVATIKGDEVLYTKELHRPIALATVLAGALGTASVAGLSWASGKNQNLTAPTNGKDKERSS